MPLAHDPEFDALGESVSPFPFVLTVPGSAGDVLIAALYISNDEHHNPNPPIIGTNVESISDFYGWTVIHEMSSDDGRLYLMRKDWVDEFIEWELTASASWAAAVGAFPPRFGHLISAADLGVQAGEAEYEVPISGPIMCGVLVTVTDDQLAYALPPAAGEFEDIGVLVTDLDRANDIGRLYMWAYEPGDNPATFTVGFDGLLYVAAIGQARWFVGHMGWTA